MQFCSVANLRNVYTMTVFSLSHTKQVRVFGACLFKGSSFSNLDSIYTRIGSYPWRSYLRLFSSSANTDDQSKPTANDKLKALKKKKEAKRIERLSRQRINDLKRNVCIFLCCVCVLHL